jgi:serine/threonine protein kinase
VEREIHASSRSQSYLVRDRGGRPLLMKTPSVNHEDDPRYVERFILEQWVGKRVESRHLVRSVDPPDDRSCLYNLMEYVDGKALSEWMQQRRGRLPKDTREVVAIVAQIVRGLVALHRKQILHQDIKPGTVLIDAAGNVTIVDYGSCRVAGIDELARPIDPEVALGTRSYSAPEFALGFRPAQNADLYSLACVAYELLTGRLPYGEAAESARTRADFNALRYVPASSINPHVPVWADAALEKAVAIEARDRYQELSEFLYDLEHPNPEFLRKRAPSGHEGSDGWRHAALGLLIVLISSWVYFLRGR